MAREINIFDTPLARDVANRLGMDGNKTFANTWNTYILYGYSICFCGVMLTVEFEDGQNNGEFFFVSGYEGNTLYLTKYDFLNAQLQNL